MRMAEQLYEVGSKLPPSELAELLDFAVFLQKKCASVPRMQHRSLGELKGGLENSATFAGFPTAIQEEMRREWD